MNLQDRTYRTEDYVVHCLYRGFRFVVTNDIEKLNFIEIEKRYVFKSIKDSLAINILWARVDPV